ncbi:hypothetical protein psyc5s11_45600 [Clostridium gelidum]|uniref:Uncharacterized protein n=1 Tax=Clostridium gelidum TaxID=704125 RepID=A0ABM7T9T7_9CLOT|nr:hypothetical protein [Clostridium gelidum]BCZ48493.1 hypothetical protein psyc5s11_45600 [Clostridium gelidum]
MKNKKLFCISIFQLITISIMLLTVSQNHKLSDNIFDNLMIIYGLLFLTSIIAVIVIMVVAKKQRD